VQIGEETARENPDECAKSYSIALSSLAGLEFGQQNGVEAMKAINKLIALYEDLSARNPSMYRADLAQAYHNIGYICDDTGDKTGGIHYTLEGLNIREDLLKFDFDNTALALAWSHNNVGNMYRDIGELEKAQPHLERAYALRLKWVEAVPGRKLQELSKSASLMADLCKAKKDAAGEALWLARVVEQWRMEDAPLQEQAMPAHSVAEVYCRLGRMAEANDAVDLAARGFQESFAQLSPDKEFADWANAGCNLASALTLKGDWASDEATLKRSADVAGQVLARMKTQDTSTNFTWGALMNNLGHSQYRLGEMHGNIVEVRQGLETLRASVAHHKKTGSLSAADETMEIVVKAEEALKRMEETVQAIDGVVPGQLAVK
jgi:tetratricopeptide (TPR) repeat protein